MSLSALFFIGVYAIGILLSFTKGPWYGLLTYFFVYYNFPLLHWWQHDLPSITWSKIMVIIILISYFLHKSSEEDTKLPAKPSFFSYPQTIWFLLLLLDMAVVTFSPLAVSRQESWRMMSEFLEFFLKYYLFINIIDTPDKFRWILWANMIGCFYWGWEAWRDPSLTHGRLEGLGGPDSANSNNVAAHVVAFVPLLIFYVLYAKGWRKFIPLGMLAFVLNLIILTNSRAAVVGLAVALLIMIILIRRKMKIKVIVGITIAALLFVHLTDQRFWERQKTLTEDERDGSSAGRIETWKGGIQLIRDHPFGVGGYGSDYLSPIYWPEVVEAHEGQLRTMHNTYLMMAADWGVLGLLFFLGLLITSLVFFLRYGRKYLKLRVSFASEFSGICMSLYAGYCGFLVCSFFNNRQWAELNYWIVSFGVISSFLYFSQLNLSKELGN